MDETGRQRSPVSPKKFLRMAWLANPFAYLAINTVVAVIPTLANRLDLSPKSAGFFCSVWFFVRAASFLLLWLWTGWHYRFRWLVTAYAGIVLSFAVMLLGPNLWVLIGAQVTFGLSLGLVYSSSLFYSMDVGETKGEHGGIHEAAIGMGACGGPAIGAAALILSHTSGGQHVGGDRTSLRWIGWTRLVAISRSRRSSNDPSRRE
jgi:predicted MFS family arabinose efflux permease